MDSFMLIANLERQAAEEVVNLVERERIIPRLLQTLMSLLPVQNPASNPARNQYPIGTPVNRKPADFAIPRLQSYTDDEGLGLQGDHNDASVSHPTWRLD